MIAGVRRLLDGVTKWASQRESILAVALVGSQANGTASACSDVDLIVLVRDADEFLRDTSWIEAFGQPIRHLPESYGNLAVIRVWYQNGLEVEFGFSDERWPLDAGGQAVIAAGIRVLLDRGPLNAHHDLGLGPTGREWR